MIVEIPEFSCDMYMSYLFSHTGQVCIGLGWDLGQILYTIKTNIQMRDCYKILLYDICDLTNLEGDSAFWIKKCEPSTSTIVTVQNQELSPQITD